MPKKKFKSKKVVLDAESGLYVATEKIEVGDYISLDMQKHDATVEAIFCARCLWYLQNYLTSVKKVADKFKGKAADHYLKHMADALKIIAGDGGKIIKFKKK